MGTAIGIAIGVPFNRRRAGGLSPEAQNWQTWIIANGGTIPLATLTIIDDNLIKPAVAAGIWAELDRLNLYAGLLGYEIAARTCMVRGTLVTPVSSPLFNANGYKSAGAGSYLNLNFNPNTDKVNTGQNSIKFGYCVKNQVIATTYAMGCFDGSTSRLAIGNIGNTATNPRVFVNSDSTGDTDRTQTTLTGFRFLYGRRSNSTTQFAGNNGETSESVNSVAIPSFNMFELEVNNAGSPLGLPDTSNYHAASWCASDALIQANLETYIVNTLTALGV